MVCFGVALWVPLWVHFLVPGLAGTTFSQVRHGGLVVPEGITGRERNRRFSKQTFLVMGRIAKADGRVSEDEIQMASAIMREMRLSDQQRRAAIDLFNQGKQPSTDITDALSEFRRVAGSSTLHSNVS